MGTTNYGRQIIRFRYSQPATSQSFNHLLYSVMPTGIYSGGTLTKINNSSVELSSLICFIKDSNFTYTEPTELYDIEAVGIATLIETTSNINIPVTPSEPYIVLNLDWVNASNNYMDVYAKSKAWIDANPDAIVIGRVIYDAGIMDSSFDYTLRDDAPLEELNDVRDYFKVIPTEPISDQIKITAGKFKSNNDIIDFSESTSIAISDTTTDPRTDIVYIDSNGDIQIEEGTPSATPVAPDYKGRFVIAEISREGSRSTVAGNEINQIYNRYIPETIQEITYENGYEFYGSKTLKGYTNCSDIFTVCTQGTGCRAIVGCTNNNCGVYGYADRQGVYGQGNHCGVYGCASCYGVYGYANFCYGVYGCSTVDAGVYGHATDCCGVFGQANLYGVYGHATSNYGVYGCANSCYGVYGRATYCGVHGCATACIGVDGSAPTYGVRGLATSGNYGVYGCGTCYGVIGKANTTIGVNGCAPNCGVYGHANCCCGVYGYASCNYGVYGCSTCYGVYGKADCRHGVYGCSTTCYGVYGKADCRYGVNGCAYNCGVYGYGYCCYGVYGHAGRCFGVYGCAYCGCGVMGKTDGQMGVYGRAPYNGLCGHADTCYGVMGEAENIAVCGCATSGSISISGNTGYTNTSDKYKKLSEKNVCFIDCFRNYKIPINRWYWEDSNTRTFDEFISPYAQDIKDMFDLTFEDESIFTVDGIALGLAQELLYEFDKLKDKVDDLKEEIYILKKRI